MKKLLLIDDMPMIRSCVEKQADGYDVAQVYRIPEDEESLREYDALVVDGDGIGNSRYRNGLEFLKKYSKPEGQSVVYHSGLSIDGSDHDELEKRGVAVVLKGGNPEKLALCIRFPMEAKP